MSVPGHDDVGEQRERPGDGDELLCRAAVLRGDASIVDRPLQAMDGLTLVEQIKDVRAECRIAEVIAEVERAKQLAHFVAGFVDGIASGS